MCWFLWSSQLLIPAGSMFTVVEKGEYLGALFFLFWMYARYWLGMILFQIYPIFVILLLVSGRAWRLQDIQEPVVACALHTPDKTQFLVQSACLCSKMKPTKWMQQGSRGQKIIVTETPQYVNCLPASFTSSKSIFYMTELLVTSNPVSKEESVSSAAFCMCNNKHHSN